MSTSTSTEATSADARLYRTAERIGRRSRERDKAALLALVDMIVAADTWDEQTYDVRPDGDWLLIRRDSWGAIRNFVETVDAWRPWEADAPGR